MWNLADTGGVRRGNSSTMTTERTEPTDTELVARARAGDGAAFGALVGRYQTAALRLAAAISGSAVDAADIAQEAFVKAHRSLPRLTDPTMVRSWMLRIVANEAKNHLRGRARRRRARRAVRLVGGRRGARSGDAARWMPRRRATWVWHSAASGRAIDRCWRIATSPDCRRPRPRRPRALRSARSSRGLRGRSPGCESKWSGHDRPRTLTGRARRATGDPGRRLAGRRRACVGSREPARASGDRPRASACRCRWLALSSPWSWSCCPVRVTPSPAGSASTACASNRASRCRHDRDARPNRRPHPRPSTTVDRTGAEPGLGLGPAVSIDEAMSQTGLPDPTPRCSESHSRSTSCDPPDSGQIVMVYAPSDLVPQSEVTGVGALVSVLPAQIEEGFFRKTLGDDGNGAPRRRRRASTATGSRARRTS